eukprot:TRINITY_DN3094_c0_g1_i3.p1 TRINITY_DN3094_c0_g1~~TRINITY_DN3094_c0_g1_i3.p1  ORF type:complete len:289 (+),score=13.08 TRINITY_DN3094_c0_g1_i3:107-973(+)
MWCAQRHFLLQQRSTLRRTSVSLFPATIGVLSRCSSRRYTTVRGGGTALPIAPSTSPAAPRWTTHWRPLHTGPPAASPGNTSACSSPRSYYYWIDELGRLYCVEESTTRSKMPSGPTFLNDAKFLNFFFRRLQSVDDYGKNVEPPPPLYQHVSPCGPEINYIACEDTPIVFHTLRKIPQDDADDADVATSRRRRRKSTDDAEGCSHELLYGSDLAVGFKPHSLRVSGSGRVYHPVPGPLRYALVKSHLVLELGADEVTVNDDGSMGIVFEGQSICLPRLPPDFKHNCA